MKRLTIEQAERIPQRLSIHKRVNKLYQSTSNQIQPAWKYYDRRRNILPWKRIREHINKYVGKSWDECYSAFRKWLKSNRKLRKDASWLVDNFKHNFTNFNSCYTYWCKYTINDDGIIEKLPIVPKKHYPVYKNYIYKYNITEDSYSYYRDFRFSDKLSYNWYCKCLKGLNEDEFYKFKALYPDKTYFLTKIGIGEPITDKKLLYKVLKERKSKLRKYKREIDLEKKKQLEAESFGSFKTHRENKKQLKKLAIEQAKLEELSNSIERDRLGFNEDSFRQPQKFTK